MITIFPISIVNRSGEREFDQFDQNGELPALEFVRLMHDHMGNFGTAIDGVNTPERQQAGAAYWAEKTTESISAKKDPEKFNLIGSFGRV